jgi:cyclic pyranopterin phosphate synthase
MVDVGTKPATKRVAIAAASVSFSNPEPLRLISENSNKKGDVLSVARIAGIMAAKRTADLIPLCHPVAISKIDVDVVLRQPTSSERSTGSTQGSGGGVDILVQVQCIGPTGVEMEALVGANGAAMTVFDMCKAVDRRIHIQSLYVPYKSGGNSGLHYHEKWAIRCGTAFFKDRGIEIPDNLMTERKAELKEFTRKRKAKMAEIRRSESDKVTTGPSAQHKAE